MHYNSFTVIFWFNIFENHEAILNNIQEEFQGEYENLELKKELDDNLFTPAIFGINDEKMTNMAFSRVNLRYTMDKVDFKMFDYFRNHALNLLDILNKFGIQILYSSVHVNCEKSLDNALDNITKNLITAKMCDDDLVDVSLKFGKKYEDLFYKIITLINKKQIKLPKKLDDNGNVIPLFLMSWKDALIETELIEINYEINDKYSYDVTKNYHTTEFYLNKMLYILENNLESDIDNLIKKGNF